MTNKSTLTSNSDSASTPKPRRRKIRTTSKSQLNTAKPTLPKPRPRPNASTTTTQAPWSKMLLVIAVIAILGTLAWLFLGGRNTAETNSAAQTPMPVAPTEPSDCGNFRYAGNLIPDLMIGEYTIMPDGNIAYCEGRNQIRIVSPAAPAAPTPAPAAPPKPAAHTNTTSNCIDPYTLDDLTNKPHGFWVRVSSESCAFTHRTYPNSFTTICPQGDFIGQFVCTFDVLGDKVVHEGIGQSATVWGATVRFMPSYQGENVCTVWHNEVNDGQQRANPFTVRFQPVSGGIQSCP